jgi:hypothetical protein
MGFNNLQESIVSYTHKFNNKWWTTFEFQYMYMKNCITAPNHQVPLQDGFFPVHGGFVAEGGVLNYTMLRLAGNTFLTIRNEWFDDNGGARTGYASSYDENSIGITWWPTKLIVFRPEVRFEHSFASSSFNPYYDSRPMHGAYDNGTKSSQVTFACDITYHF